VRHASATGKGPGGGFGYLNGRPPARQVEGPHDGSAGERINISSRVNPFASGELMYTYL